MKAKSLEIDMIAGSELRDVQGEILSVEGADISELQEGRGRLNDNHGKGFFNSIGRITFAKKIFKAEDCSDDRQKYYWNQVKAPYIYVKGVLFDNDDHPNARAAAAILRNIHKADCPLQLKASVEGGVSARGLADPTYLARTKIHSVALTFTPANQATLVEPTNLSKCQADSETDLRLIKSVMHLACTDVPSFRHITRMASADHIIENILKIVQTIKKSGIEISPEEEAALLSLNSATLTKAAAEWKIIKTVQKINDLVKMLSAGYGGASAPSSRTGGAVLQSEAVSETKPKKTKGFSYFVCQDCGKEQIHSQWQTKCRHCGKPLPLDQLSKLI